MPRTTHGRIVYDRKPHLFRYSDVLRIVRKVEVRQDPDKRVEDLGNALAAVLAAVSDVFRALQNLLPRQRVFWAARLILGVYSELENISSLIPEWAGSTLQQIVDSIRGIGGAENGENDDQT